MVIDVETQEFIKKDSKAIIGTDGLMGNKIMNITPGTKGNPEIKDNDMIGTTIPVSFDDILLKLKTTSDNAVFITNDLAAIIGNISSGRGTIGKLLMDTVFLLEIDKTLENVKQGSKGFKQTMDAAQDSRLLGGFFDDDEDDKADKRKEKKEEDAEALKVKKAEKQEAKKKLLESKKKKAADKLKAKKKLTEEKKKQDSLK